MIFIVTKKMSDYILAIPRFVKNYEVYYPLGSGSTSTVFQARDTRTGEFVALKFVSRKIFDDVKYLQNIEKELRILQRLRCPYIAKYIDTVYLDDYIVIVMELLSGGKLSTYISSVTKKLDDKIYLRWAKEILTALDYLHSNNISHRDIKPDNIAFDSQMHAKLVDFGLSTENKLQKCNSFCGTVFYVAPELVTENEYDAKKADIWSFGLTLHTLIFKNPPFPFTSQNEFFKGIMHIDKYMNIKKGSVFSSLIEKCLVIDPEKRATARELLNDPIFKDENLELRVIPRNNPTLIAKPVLTRRKTISSISIANDKSKYESHFPKLALQKLKSLTPIPL